MPWEDYVGEPAALSGRPWVASLRYTLTSDLNMGEIYGRRTEGRELKKSERSDEADEATSLEVRSSVGTSMDSFIRES